MGKNGKSGKRVAVVPPGAYRVRASIELDETRKAVELFDYADDTDVTRDAATALAKVVDEVLNHFGVELSRKDSAARAMVTIAQTAGLLPSEIDEGTPLHVNTDQVVEQVRRAFAVLEDMAGNDPVSVVLSELHELLLPFDGLDNVVANALPFRVRALLAALEKARETESGRVRDALVEVARLLKMVPEGTPPGTSVSVDLDALFDKVRWYAETLDSVLALVEPDGEDDRAIGIAERVRERLTEHRLLTHNHTPVVGEPELRFGVTAAKPYRELLAEVAERVGITNSDTTREQVLAEIGLRERDRQDLHHRMFVLLRVLGLIDEFDDGFREVSTDARVVIETRVREWKARLDAVGEPAPDGLVSALKGLRSDLDMSPLPPNGCSPQAWDVARQRVRELAAFARSATGALRLGPSGELGPVLDELRAQVAFTDDVARLLKFEHDGDASYTDLRNELAERLENAPLTGSTTADAIKRYREFVVDMANGLGFDGGLVSLDAVAERVAAQHQELRELRSMADQVALNLGLPRDATPAMIADRTAKFSAVQLGADLAAHEEFVRTACADLGLTGPVELNDLRFAVKDLLSYKDFADDARRNLHMGSAPLGDVMLAIGRLQSQSQAAPRWQWTEGATVELFTKLSEPPTNKVGSGNTDVVTSWLERFHTALKAEFAVLDFHLTFDVAMGAVDRARDAVLSQAPTIAMAKVPKVAGPTVAVPPVPLSMVTNEAAERAAFDVSSFGFATFASELRDMASKPEVRGNHDPETLRMVASLCDRMPAKVRSMLKMHGELNERYDRVGALETDAKIRAQALLEALGRKPSGTPTASEFFGAVDDAHALRADHVELLRLLECEPHEVVGRVEALVSRQSAQALAFARIAGTVSTLEWSNVPPGDRTPDDVVDVVKGFVERMTAQQGRLARALNEMGVKTDTLRNVQVFDNVVARLAGTRALETAVSRIRSVMLGAVDGAAPMMSPQEVADRVAWFVERHGSPAMVPVLDENHVEKLGVVLRDRAGASSHVLTWVDLVRVVLRHLDENGVIDFDSVHKVVPAGVIEVPVTDPEATATLSLPGMAVRHTGERDGRAEQ